MKGKKYTKDIFQVIIIKAKAMFQLIKKIPKLDG
jgi:hypothetical protein